MKSLDSRREFIKTLAGAVIAPHLIQDAAISKSSDPDSRVGHSTVADWTSRSPKVYLEAFEYAGVQLRDGRLKKQVDETRNYYYNLPNDDILIGFRRRAGMPAPGNEFSGWYGGEPTVPDVFKDWWMAGDTFNVFGQWLSGMARLAKATNDIALLDKAKTLMTEWGRTIEPDGYFYYSRKPLSFHYTYEKTLCGLVDMYAYGRADAALPLIERITDWAIKNLERTRTSATPGGLANADGTEWYTLPENLYRAYQLTGNTKYRDFADVWRYTNYWDKFNDSPNPNIQGLHAYSHCNTLSSAAMAYSVHGDSQYLKTIVNAYDYFERTQFYATGGFGPGEALVAPDGSLGRSVETQGNTFETPCGCWAGFKLVRYLFQFTGDAKYGDWTEKLLYNGIGAALPMSGRGNTYYYSDYRLGGSRKQFYWAKFPCCSGTYIQDVADYYNLIYFKSPASLYINLFLPSEVIWNHDGTEVKVEQETNFPETDTTVLTIRPSRATAFDLKFRVPRWTQGVTVELNEVPYKIVAIPGTWAGISRTWKSGDRVSIRLGSQLALSVIDAQHPRRVALTYGPVVLVREDRPTLALRTSEIAKGFEVGDEPLEFKSVRQPSSRTVPFYRIGFQEPYTMYFDLNA